MQTLLEKVHTIEAEAATLIERAKEAGHKQLDEMIRREEQVITTLRTKAEQRGESIVQEHLQKVSTEINAIKQESEQAVAMVHTGAEQNRAQAVSRAHHLFEETYLKANS